MDPKLYKIAKNGSRNFSINLDDVDSEQRVTRERNTILHIAAKSGNKQSTDQILQSYPLLVHETNTKGETPLHIAARLGHFDVARLLITCAKQQRGEESGDIRSLRAVSKKKLTVLHEAVKNDHLDVVDLLIKEDPTLTSTSDESVESPLFMALERRFYQVALRILETFPNCSCSGRNGMTIMHAAVLGLPPGLIITMTELLLFRNRSSHSISGPGELASQLFGFSRKCMEILCSATSNLMPPSLGITMRNSLNQLLLGFRNIWSHSISGADFVKKLLEKTGPGILEEKDCFGWTPLHYAAYIGNQDVVKLFLETNSSLAYTKNNEGLPALHIAAQRGSIRVIKTLIQKCPDVSELLDDKDQTALHVAVANGNVHTVMRCLRMMAFKDLLNETTKDGNTCLHVAALQGYDEIVLMLVNDKRVDHTAINNLGMTAADIIMSRKNMSPYEKVLFASWKKFGVHQTSLERRVVRESRMAQLEMEKLLKTTQETEIEVPSQDNKPAGPSDTPITSAQENEKGLLSFIDPKIDSRTGLKYNHNHIHIKNSSAINLLVATIIASITFSSLLQMPGGYNNDGMPNLRNFKTFRIFVLFDSLAFGLSAASICLHFASPIIAMISGQKSFYPLSSLTFLTGLSICFTLVAFFSAWSAVLNEGGKFNFLDLVPFICSFVFPLVYFMIFDVINRARALYALPYLFP